MKLIVNAEDADERFVQLVDTEICGQGVAGRACSNGEIGGRSGLFPTECRQEYTEHKLVAIDTVTEEPEVDSFPLPSCCTCYKTSP